MPHFWLELTLALHVHGSLAFSQQLAGVCITGRCGMTRCRQEVITVTIPKSYYSNNTTELLYQKSTTAKDYYTVKLLHQEAIIPRGCHTYQEATTAETGDYGTRRSLYQEALYQEAIKPRYHNPQNSSSVSRVTRQQECIQRKRNVSHSGHGHT
jgi:hypothetical protein